MQPRLDVADSPRRLVLALLVLAYVLVAALGPGALSGLVRPAARPGEVASLDFPCAHHVCGCTDAETCRTSCCCFPRAPEAAACPRCADEHAGAATPAHGQLSHRGGTRAEREPPRAGEACPGSEATAGHGPRSGAVIRCGCPVPAAFLDGRQPDQDRRHESFRTLALAPAGSLARPASSSPLPAEQETPSRVPIAS